MSQNSRSVRLCSQRAWQIFIGAFGFFLGIGGILNAMFWDQTLANILQEDMILRPGSIFYDNWKNPPGERSLDIYLYNWTNPEDFRNLATKPILEQCGPYRFTETPDKVDIAWHPENSSVTYRRKSLFHFDAAGSIGSLDDEITTLNAVALSFATKIKFRNFFLRSVVDAALRMHNQHISVTKTADELLFKGYDNDMFTMASKMPTFENDVEVPFDRFGWFYGRNDSADLSGIFNVFTGAEDASRLGQMHTWNFKQHSGFFDSHCGMVNGSAGEFYPPNLTHDSVVGLFIPDMCRTLPLEYTDTVEIEGITGYKYSGGPRSMDNGTLFPENLCFCGGQCFPSGVMNVSSCRFGSPEFMSYPHFYQADPYFINNVEGLAPSKDQHEFYMILEPKTGQVLEVAARLQVNMLVEPLEPVRLYEGVPRIFFPLLWFEQKVRITPELAGELKVMLSAPATKLR